jgi:hypothetical protein
VYERRVNADLAETIQKCFADRTLLTESEPAIREVIARLDRGELRVAERAEGGE